MLAYAEKLTRTPAQVDGDDAQRLRDAGFDDRQILDVILITSLFNFMTRLADGTGTRAEESFRSVKARKDAQMEEELQAQPARA